MQEGLTSVAALQRNQLIKADAPAESFFGRDVYFYNAKSFGV